MSANVRSKIHARLGLPPSAHGRYQLIIDQGRSPLIDGCGKSDMSAPEMENEAVHLHRSFVADSFHLPWCQEEFGVGAHLMLRQDCRSENGVYGTVSDTRQMSRQMVLCLFNRPSFDSASARFGIRGLIHASR